MPIYEYQCDACQQISEFLVRTPASEVERRCEHCGSTALTRKISRPGLIRSRTPQGEAGTLRPVHPKQAVRHMSDAYDQAGVDPGEGFSEVVRRVGAGDRPEELKEAVREARRKEAGDAASPSDT